MNARFVTLVLLLFVWLEGDSVWAQYLPKLYQVFSPDKKLKMAIQRHNDGLLTYTFAANREILIKESPLGFKLIRWKGKYLISIQCLMEQSWMKK